MHHLGRHHHIRDQDVVRMIIYSNLINIDKTDWDKKGLDQMSEIGSVGDHIPEIGSLKSKLDVQNWIVGIESQISKNLEDPISNMLEM